MIRFFIFGIGLITNVAAYCQQHKFETVAIQSTILSSEVTDLLQDQSGFIWVASSEGLGRYDGHNAIEYKHYKNIESSICNNGIHSISEDANGKIWIGTKGGLSVYDPISENTRCLYYDGKNILRGDNIILSVLADQKGYVWYSTYNGLYRLDPKTETREVFLPEDGDPYSISGKVVFSIFEDRDGVLWFACSSGISYYKNDDSFRFENILPDASDPNGLKHNKFFTFCQSDNGDLWLGGDSGFYKVLRSEGKIKFVNYYHDVNESNSLSYNYVNHLLADGNDLWVSTWAGGLDKVVFDEKGQNHVFTHYRNEKNNPHSLETDEVNVTLIDKSGVLWAGTGFGLMKSSLSTNKFGLIKTKPNVPNSLTNNKVQSTLVDSEGNLWVGTDNGLNFRPSQYNKNEAHFINFRHQSGVDNSLTHNNIFDIYEDSSRRIWIATYDGFSIADLNTFEKTRTFKKMKFKKYPHKWVYNILEVEKDIFWISTYGKMAKMHFPINAKEPDLKIYDMDPDNPDALSNATTYQTCKDSKGRIWVGTFFGLSMIDANDDCTTFVNFYKNREEAGSISDVTINCLFSDKDGRLWIGTRNGLNLLVEDIKGNMSFRSFDEFAGLPNSVINFIEEDFQGMLWIGTGDGVVHFDPKKAEGNDNAIINVYSYHDGLGKNNTAVRSSCNDKEGNIYFGTDGLNYFNPKNLVFNKNVSELIFTKLKVLNEEVTPKTNGILRRSISKKETEINLQYDDNMIEIFFSCLDFSNPQKNRYKYKMEGVNDDWVNSGNQNSATFTNLSAGSYIFNVIGCNNDGIWNDQPISVTINVAPHWSGSGIAYSLYLLLGSILFGLFYKWRNARANEKIKIIKDLEAARFEERENLRKKNAADFHDELGHRLTKIALFVEIAGKQAIGNEKLEKYLEKVKTNTKSLSEGLKDLIWSLDPKKDTVLDTINRIQEVGDSIFDYSDMKFSTHAIDPDYENIKLSASERKHILLIFKEAMNNTLKYSHADQCVFNSEIRDRKAYFIFKDDGVGFDMEAVGKGNGLINMKDRSEKIGGVLEMEAAKNNGVKITISIPIADNAFLMNKN